MIQDKGKSQVRDCNRCWTDIRYVFLGWEVGKVWSGPGLRKQIPWEVSWVHEEEISCQAESQRESQRDSQRTLEEKLCSPEGSLPQPLTSSEKLTYHRELPQPPQSRLNLQRCFSWWLHELYSQILCKKMFANYTELSILQGRVISKRVTCHKQIQFLSIKNNKTKQNKDEIN